MAEAKTGDGAYTPRLRKDYDERIAKAMSEKFGYKNKLEPTGSAAKNNPTT